MDYKAPVEAYTGVVREVTIGKEDKSLKIGGENILPLHFFEGFFFIFKYFFCCNIGERNCKGA